MVGVIEPLLFFWQSQSLEAQVASLGQELTAASSSQQRVSATALVVLSVSTLTVCCVLHRLSAHRVRVKWQSWRLPRTRWSRTSSTVSRRCRPCSRVKGRWAPAGGSHLGLCACDQEAAILVCAHVTRRRPSWSVLLVPSLQSPSHA